MKWDSRVLTRGQGGLELSCGCHHGHASHCFTKHAASGHTQSGIWALFHCTVHNAWFDRKFTHKYLLVCLIWGLGSFSDLHDCQSCGCHHGHASLCFTKHAASGHTQSGIWALFNFTMHNSWFDRKFTQKYLLVYLIWGLGSVSVLHAQMARTLVFGVSLVAVTMATPPTVLQNTLPVATHNLEFEHYSTAQCTMRIATFLKHYIAG